MVTIKEMQTLNLNVGEWVMGMKYSGFTRFVLYSNIYPIDSCTSLFENPILRGTYRPARRLNALGVKIPYLDSPCDSTDYYYNE